MIIAIGKLVLKSELNDNSTIYDSKCYSRCSTNGWKYNKKFQSH